jgi:hypothetical protein
MKNANIRPCLYAFVAVFCVAFAACKQDKPKDGKNTVTTAATTPTIVLPETPVEVVKMWESNFDKNEYDLILPISAGENLKYVISLIETDKMAIEKGMPIEKPLPSQIAKIIQITCNTNGEKGECICLKEEEGARYNVKSIIVRENNQWKVLKSEVME